MKNVQDVGREMCENKIIKKVSFTGSTPVAKLLYGMAASTLKKYGVPSESCCPNLVEGYLWRPEETPHSLYSMTLI